VKIALAPEAVEDLAAAVAYLYERNPQAAAEMADRVFAAIDSLAAREFDGPECELRRTGERVRSWSVRPYRLYYRREGDTFIVLRLHHSARRPIAR
jgi:plasmid stabilization system protein ParE